MVLNTLIKGTFKKYIHYMASIIELLLSPFATKKIYI